MNYVIRKAQACDEEKLMDLVKTVWDQCFRCFLGDEYIDSYVESELVERDIQNSIEHIQILEEGQNIIGYCVWMRSLLSVFMIAPEYQGKGIGTYFLEETAKKPIEEFGEVILECFEENRRAVGFYEKLNFTVYDRGYDKYLKLVRLYYRKRWCQK